MIKGPVSHKDIISVDTLIPCYAGLIYTLAYSRDIYMVALSHENILSALAKVESEWQVHVGAHWPKIEQQYLGLRAQLEKATGATQMQAAPELVQLPGQYVPARK